MMKKLKTGILALATLALVGLACKAAQVEISWPANPESEQITSYTVQVSTNAPTAAIPTTPYGTLASVSGATNLSTTLPNNQRYWIRILANNTTGTGAASTAVPTPGIPTQVGTPTVITTP